MAKKYLRNILLYILLHAVSRPRLVTSSLEVAVEGDRIEIKCPMNSSHGVVWKYYNATNAYTLYEDGVVLRQFLMDYNVTNINNSLYKISCLTITRVKKSNAGTYTCLDYENRHQILTSMDLALLTIPKCEPDINSTETAKHYVCSFTSAGNISAHLERIKDLCTNSTPTVCSIANEGIIYCEFPINRRNLTVLPFATNLSSHGIHVEACTMSYTNWNETSTDGLWTKHLNMSVQISGLLQCLVNPYLTIANRPTDMIMMITNTTPARSPGKTGSEFYLIASVVVSITGVLLTLIIIAIFRNTDACSCGRESRDKHNIEERFGEQIDDNSHFYHEAGSGVQTGGGPIYHVLEPSCNGTTPGHPAIALSNTHEKMWGNPVYADPDEIRPAPIYEEIPNV